MDTNSTGSTDLSRESLSKPLRTRVPASSGAKFVFLFFKLPCGEEACAIRNRDVTALVHNETRLHILHYHFHMENLIKRLITKHWFGMVWHGLAKLTWCNLNVSTILTCLKDVGASSCKFSCVCVISNP